METNKYKKGDVLLITYKEDSSGEIITSGVLFDISQLKITLAHNFSEKIPLDKTILFIKDVINSKIVVPKELNSINDISDYTL